MIRNLTFIILFLFSNNIIAQELHSNWDKLLSNYVNSKGEVDYKSWVNNQDGINYYFESLLMHDLKFDSKEAEKAFWMNLYNAATIKIVLKNFPINSIKQIENGNVWELKWIKINGNTFSLNQIENEIIRKKFDDPRIHFGINCAAVSCPKLNNRAFTASNLEDELNKLTTQFINEKSNVSNSSIAISKIFEWYKVDFTKDGSIQVYLNKYLIKKVPTDIHIKYSDYNWGLNKQE